MKLIFEGWKKYLKEGDSGLPPEFEEFGFSDEERGESEGKPPALQTLLDLDRDDKFTIGARKPIYRVIGTKDKGTRRKRIVIDGSAERKMYILKVVDEDTYDVAAFEVVGGGTNTKKKSRGKSGAIQKIDQGEKQ
mgnify:FL=1